MASYGPYYCMVCQTATNGPEPFRQHNQSAKHLKKASLGPSSLGSSSMDMSGLGDLILTPAEIAMIGLMPASLSPAPAPSGQPSNYYCQACSVSMSGYEPYQQHMSSLKHMKKAKLAAEGYSVVPSQSQNTNMNMTTASVDSINLALQKDALTDVLIIPPNEEIGDYMTQLGF